MKKLKGEREAGGRKESRAMSPGAITGPPPVSGRGRKTSGRRRAPLRPPQLGNQLRIDISRAFFDFPVLYAHHPAIAVIVRLSGFRSGAPFPLQYDLIPFGEHVADRRLNRPRELGVQRLRRPFVVLLFAVLRPRNRARADHRPAHVVGEDVKECGPLPTRPSGEDVLNQFFVLSAAHTALLWFCSRLYCTS